MEEVIEERKIVRLINDLVIKNYNLADIIIGYYNNYSQIKFKETSGYVVLNSGYSNRFFFSNDRLSKYKESSIRNEELRLKYLRKIRDICKGIIKSFIKSMFQPLYILHENSIIVFYGNSIPYIEDLSTGISVRSKNKLPSMCDKITNRINFAKEVSKIGGDGVCVAYNRFRDKKDYDFGIKIEYISQLFSFKFPYRGSDLDNFIIKKYKDEQLVIMNFKNE